MRNTRTAKSFLPVFLFAWLPQYSLAQGLPSSSFSLDGAGAIVAAVALSVYLNVRLVRSTGSKWLWLAWPVVFAVSYSITYMAGIILEKLT